jgi:hypothetical protein
MKIKIKNPTGKEKSLIVNSSDLISKAKINAGLQGYIWKFNGEVLKDEKTIDYYGIEDDDTIISNIPVPGG